MNLHIKPVDTDKYYRLLNHGPTVMVSANHGGIDNVMTASWVCVLDFSPTKITMVLDKASKTREFIEKSGTFMIQVPTVSMLKSVYDAGHMSLSKEPDKLSKCGINVFRFDGFDLPAVNGCSAWLACKLIPETKNQETYDLLIGEVVSAWADKRVFDGENWIFDKADAGLRSIHYATNGRFYAIGELLQLSKK